MTPKLSKTVLEMKFMKRTKERLALEAAAEREQVGGAAAARRQQERGTALVETSLATLLDLQCGRYSCRGINPALERLIELESQPAETAQPGVDVSDKEMAAFFNPLVTTMASKFDKDASNSRKGKRKHQAESKNETQQTAESPRSEIQNKKTKRNFLKPNL